MGYYKIFDAFSIKQGDKLIPFVIIGESNLIEEDPHTHRRRVSRWPQLAHWLYSSENRNEVEIKDENDLKRLLLYPSLIEDYKGGDVQGISLNTIIKRILNNVIDNDKLHARTEIGDLNPIIYHSDLTPEQIERLRETKGRYNSQINRILLKDERIALYNNFIKEFDDDPKIQKEIKNNYDNYLEGFFDDYINEEELQKELRKLKIARLMERYNKRHQISEQSDKEKLYA